NWGAIVLREQVQAEHRGLVASQDMLDRGEVAERMRHLLHLLLAGGGGGDHVQGAVVGPVVDKWLLAGDGFTLGDFVFVVGEDQVSRSPMNIYPVAQLCPDHGRALDVPAGPSRTPGAVPPGLAGLGRFPEGEIPRILLCPLTLSGAAPVDRGNGLLAAGLQAAAGRVINGRIPL